VRSAWQDALRVAAVFAEQPRIGALVRARVGPVRSRWRAWLDARLSVPTRRMPLHIEDDRLLGGLDLEATLRSGRPVAQRGFLAESDGRVVEIPMAERLSPELVGHLCATLDRGEVATEREGASLRSPARLGILAFDEHAEGEEGVPESLAERLGMRVDLEGLAVSDVEAEMQPLPSEDPLEADLVRLCCQAAHAFGVASLRPPMMAAQVARASAALDGRTRPDAADLGFALRVVLLPRATQMPAPEEPPEDEQAEQPPPEPEGEPPEPEGEPPKPEGEPPESEGETNGPGHEEAEILTEILQSNLPQGLLEELSARTRARSVGKKGAESRGAGRGRRLSPRPGRPGPGRRVDVVATLRSAAPWQGLRGREKGAGPKLRLEDLRIQRRQQRSETLTIFLVDASGSSALQRLAEAKGAVERVLADCYVRRDQVALVAFRGDDARLVLPPTRSLTRAKRELSGLAGGGPTPLADALRLARELAADARRRGRTPLVVLMTDARANVALDGRRDRAAAREDAHRQGAGLRMDDVPSLLIDTSPRPREEAKRLAEACGARLVFLPRLDADAIATAVGDVSA